MLLRFCLILFVGALLEWKPIQCAPAEVGKPKGKGRAYEFGFSIEEQQHRHEKRDENGIVMGEFGFITADGIYHVTVYATDENGKFKILAMKSYPYANPEKKMMIAMLPPPTKKPVVMPAFKKATPLDTPSCGGCVLTKKLSPADVVEQVPSPDPESVFRPLSKTLNDPAVATKNKAFPSLPARPSPPKVPSLPSLSPPPVKPNAVGATLSKAAAGAAANGKQYPLTTFRTPGPAIQPQVPANRQGKASSPSAVRPQLDIRVGSAPIQPKQLPFQKPALTSTNFQQQTPQKPFTPNTASVVPQNAKEPKALQPLNKFLPNVGGPAKSPPQLPPTQTSIHPQSKNTLPQQTGGRSAPGGGTPQLTSNKALTQPQLVNTYTPTGTQLPSTNGARTPTAQSPSTGKVTPSSQSSIGRATPSGTGSGGGGGGPLYRFKYVLDYNSHREEGRIDGSKEGNYHTVEDGIRRIIDYIANENGYQPHIKWERVPPNELPTTGENKLKDYEFVWFNSP